MPVIKSSVLLGEPQSDLFLTTPTLFEEIGVREQFLLILETIVL